jgi:hypothetical protein
MGWFVLFYTLHHASYQKQLQINHIDPSSLCYAKEHLTQTQRNSAIDMLHADMASTEMASVLNCHYSTNSPLHAAAIATHRKCYRSFETRRITGDKYNPGQLCRHTYITYVTKWIVIVCLQICKTISVMLFSFSDIIHRLISATNVYHMHMQQELCRSNPRSNTC